MTSDQRLMTEFKMPVNVTETLRDLRETEAESIRAESIRIRNKMFDAHGIHTVSIMRGDEDQANIDSKIFRDLSDQYYSLLDKIQEIKKSLGY